MNSRIRKLREDLKLSRNEFGARMYVSQDVINNVERGRVEPSGLLIKCICDTYGVSEDWLRNGGSDDVVYVANQDEYRLIEQIIRDNGNNPMLKSLLMNWMQLSESNRGALNSLSAHMVEESKKE